MKKITKVLYYITIAIFIMIFLHILSLNIYKINLNKDYNSYIITLVILLITALFFRIKEFKIFNKKIFYLIFWLLMVSLAFYVGLKTRVTLKNTWDYGAIIQHAYRIVNGIKVDVAYYARYPNNIALLIIEIVLAWFSKLYNPNITLYGFHTATILLNSIIIGTIILIFNIYVKEVVGPKAKRLSVLLSILFIPIYFYSALLYTDTVASVLMLISLIAYYGYTKCQGVKKTICFLITVLGIAIGFKYKATNSFLLIAILMSSLFEGKYKQIPKFIIGFMPSLLIINFLIGIIYPISDEEYDKYKYPYTHWIMMSMNPDSYGNYSGPDARFTGSFNTYNEKEEAISQVLKERMKTYTFKSFMKKTFVTKNLVIWADPTIAIDNYLSRRPYNNNEITNYVTFQGKKHKDMLTYLRGVYLVIIIGIFISGILIIRRPNYYIYICQIAIIGIYIFELFWEVHSRYIYNFVPLMIISSCYGYSELFKLIYKEKNKEEPKEQNTKKRKKKINNEKK